MSEIEKYYNGEIIVDFEEETELEKEYNKLAELYSKAVKKKIEYKHRIDKAIELIEKVTSYDGQCYFDLGISDCYELLNILKGDNND